MRGQDDGCDGLFSYIRLEERVPADHPLRAIRRLADQTLSALDDKFETLYSPMGRPSIAPEVLLRATLLQAFFSVRSERMLMEQINYNLLFRWFVGLPIDADVWHATVFTHNRDRLLEADVAREFLAALLSLPQVKTLLSSEHFSVDGTVIDAWASMKSFRPKDGSGEPPGPGRNGERNFHKEKRSNETHGSTTDPDARLYRKSNGRESRLCFLGHVLMENRNGLAVDATLTHATGRAEREATLTMLDRRSNRRRITLAADKAYDVEAFIGDLRARNVTPHIAVNGAVSSADTSARPPSMPARPVIPAMRSASAAASGSRRCSAGSRPRPDTPRSKSADGPRSMPSLPSPSQPTTLSGYPRSWQPEPHERRHTRLTGSTAHETQS
jgi:transposase